MTAIYLTLKRNLLLPGTFRALLKISLLLLLLIISRVSFSQAAAWGVPPKNWDDFYIGLVNDFKKPATPVNEPGYWLDVINKANTTATYTATDPNKKTVLYQYKYLNPDADTSGNWYQQQVISGLRIIDHMRMDGEAVGVRNAWVIYMLQGHDGGTAEAKANLQSAAYMEKFFWNLKYVAQKSSGNKSIFIIEPDMWGYLIKSQYLGDATVSPSMLGYAGQIAINNPAQFSYLAGLPNTLAGVCQGIVRTIRTYAPDAYVGFHVNTWTCLDPSASKPVFGCPGCVGGRTGLVWRTTGEIDWTVNYQLSFYNALFPANGDKGDFLVLEKYGANAGAMGGNEWYWDNTAMQNWLRFAQKMGQGFCRPTIMWQIQLGQTSAASTALGVPALPNTSGRYEDTFVEYMFNNFSQFLDAGLIGFLGGKGVANQTEYSLQNGYGDNGYFFKGLNTYINPGRPWNLIRGVPQPDLGNDTTICGTGGSLVLNPGNLGSGNLITWSTGATTPTITINSAGTYWVNVADGTVCGKSDTIVVSNTFTVNLGANSTLCNPSSLNLDAGHQGAGVTYVWEKNASVIPGETTRYLFVNQPGTYKVTVTDASCPPAKSAQITLSANTVVPNAAAFCFTSPGSASLSVQNNGGTYEWYSSPVSSTILHTGLSYNTPVINATTTYYVADSKVYASTIMPRLVADGYTAAANAGATNGQDQVTGTDWLYFDALVPFTLKSFKINANVSWCPGTRRGGIIISNTTTGFSFDSGLLTFPCVGTGWQDITVTLAATGILMPKANGYSIRYYTPLEAIMNVYKGTSGTLAYPRNYNNVMKATGYNSLNASTALFGHPAMFDWDITAPLACERTPIVAEPCASLPLTWINVSAEIRNTVVSVKWIAEEDELMSFYTVEKSSDGINFLPLNNSGKITAKHSLFLYEQIDETVLSNIQYYRILAHDIDGTVHYSEIISVNPLGTEISIFPNPSGSTQDLFLKAETDKLYEVNYYNINGQKLSLKSLQVKGGEKIPGTENLTQGIYILEIKTEKGLVYRKYIRE